MEREHNIWYRSLALILILCISVSMIIPVGFEQPFIQEAYAFSERGSERVLAVVNLTTETALLLFIILSFYLIYIRQIYKFTLKQVELLLLNIQLLLLITYLEPRKYQSIFVNGAPQFR